MAWCYLQAIQGKLTEAPTEPALVTLADFKEVLNGVSQHMGAQAVSSQVQLLSTLIGVFVHLGELDKAKLASDWRTEFFDAERAIARCGASEYCNPVDSFDYVEALFERQPLRVASALAVRDGGEEALAAAEEGLRVSAPQDAGLGLRRLRRGRHHARPAGSLRRAGAGGVRPRAAGVHGLGAGDGEGQRLQALVV